MGEVTDYIVTLDEPARSVLERLRRRTLELVPEATEGTSYGMAALRYRDRPLVSVVATRQGYSLFPFSSDVVARATAQLEGYESTKGGVKFTDAQPLPETVFDLTVLSRREEIDAAASRS